MKKAQDNKANTMPETNAAKVIKILRGINKNEKAIERLKKKIEGLKTINSSLAASVKSLLEAK